MEALATLHARLDEVEQRVGAQIERLHAAQERTNRLLELALQAGFDAEEELRRR